MAHKRSQRSHDHRLERLVQETGDASMATRLGVPRPTVADWLRRAPRAVDRARDVLGLRRVLSILGLSPSRLSAWRRAARACELADEPSCPGSAPQRLTPAEISRVREMVTSSDLRHVPTGRLAILAQRLGAVFASASTWLMISFPRGRRA